MLRQDLCKFPLLNAIIEGRGTSETRRKTKKARKKYKQLDEFIWKLEDDMKYFHGMDSCSQEGSIGKRRRYMKLDTSHLV